VYEVPKCLISFIFVLGMVTLTGRRVLVLLWHPHPYGATAGGFRVIYEILRRVKCNGGLAVDVLDVEPSFLVEGRCVKIHEYSIPTFVDRVCKNNVLLARILEWLMTAGLLTYYALRMHKKRPYDVVYVACAELWFTGLPALFFGWLFNVKVKLAILNVEVAGGTLGGYYSALRQMGHATLNSFIIATFTFMLSAFYSALINRANEIVTISTDLMNAIRRRGVRTKTTIMRIGIDFQTIQNIPVQEKKFDGIFVGRLSAEKGIYDLVKAWKIVAARKPDARLLIVGSTDLGADRLIQVINENHLESNIEIFVSGSTMDSGSENDRRRKVLRLLKMSRLVVFLSRIEGWGLVPLEGLACGLPVVAYALPVYKEHIRACDVAFLVPIGDYQKAATVILDILNKQQSELQEMSRKAKDFASQYDWDRLAGSAIRIIVEL